MAQRTPPSMPRYPVFDGHNDLAWECRTERDYSVEEVADTTRTLQTDIPKIQAGGLAAQFWSVFIHTDIAGADAVQATLEQIDAVYRMTQRFPDVFERTFTAEQVRRAVARGRVASLIGVEGGHQIHDSPAVLRQFARLGARYLTLTWNATTSWAEAAVGGPLPGGLTDRGREFVHLMNDIGMIVDLSHVSEATMRAAIDASRLPVMFSHSSCAALNPHPRNVPDDVERLLAVNGGVQMLTFVLPFVSAAYAAWNAAGEAGDPPPVSVEDVADHVDHARDVMGVDHVGIGSDFDGTDAMPDGLGDVGQFQNLFAVLAGRGWSDEDLRKLSFGNALRVLQDNDDAFARSFPELAR